MKSKDNKVIWTEGMSLFPHHFQQQERYFEGLVKNLFNQMPQNYWGFLELEIDIPLLSVGTIRVHKAKGYFENRNYFDTQLLGQIKDLKLNKNNKIDTIYLGVISNQDQISSDDDGNKSHYELKNIDIKDTYTGNENYESISIGMVNYFLLTNNDELSGYDVLPLLSINNIDENDKIYLKKEFIPPILNISENSILKSIHSEVLTLMEKRVNTVANIFSERYVENSLSWEEIFYLRSLNKGISLFRENRNFTRSIHPEKLFRDLKSIVADLCSICEKNRVLPNFKEYNHSNIQSSFEGLISIFRDYLSKIIKEKVIKFSLEKHKYGLNVVLVENRNLYNSTEFILQARSNLDMETLNDVFQSVVKIGAIESIRNIVNTHIKGIPLIPLRTVPSQLPSQKNCIYFALNKNNKYWKELENCSGIAIHVGKEIEGLDINLWSIKD